MQTNLVRTDDPSAQAARLLAQPKSLEQSPAPKLAQGTNYLVQLQINNGFFELSWAATTVGSYDWVGLYVNEYLPDSEYIGGNNWQWAVRGNSYDTSTPAQPGYQVRYLVWDAKAGAYKSVARSAPWSGEQSKLSR
jgi:hypothetical protein